MLTDKVKKYWTKFREECDLMLDMGVSKSKVDEQKFMVDAVLGTFDTIEALQQEKLQRIKEVSEQWGKEVVRADGLQQENEQLKKTEQDSAWFCKKLDSITKENERLKAQMIQAARGSAEIVDLAAENVQLQYTLIGVMHSVDKWFDKADESTDEVNRAAQAREIALQAIEKRDEALMKVGDVLRDISNYLYDILPTGELSLKEADFVWEINTAKTMADKALDKIAEVGE